MIRSSPYTGPLQGILEIRVQKLDPRARLPELKDKDSVGWDIFALLLTESGRPTSRVIHQRAVTEVRTGLVAQPPPNFYIQIGSRLSLARRGVFVANAPAMIPHNYKGELTIWLFNGSFETQYVAHEHRIAQLTLQPIIPIGIRELPASEHPEDVHP